MLANPQNFANWIALPYSTFAVLKFAAIASGYVLTFASLLWLVAQTIYTRFTPAKRPAVVTINGAK